MKTGKKPRHRIVRERVSAWGKTELCSAREAREDWLNERKDIIEEHDKELASMAAKRVPV